MKATVYCKKKFIHDISDENCLKIITLKKLKNCLQVLSKFFNDAFGFSSLLLHLSCRAILITGTITDKFHVLDPSYKIEKKMLIRIQLFFLIFWFFLSFSGTHIDIQFGYLFWISLFFVFIRNEK